MKKISLVLTISAISLGVLPLAVFAQIANPTVAVPPTGASSVPPATPPITVPPLEADNVSNIRACPFNTLQLQQGDKGDDVRVLQSMLAQDSTIYPAGITSGFFGTLTQEALKKLQAKNGLTQNGMMDEPTRNVIFPCANIQIISPNGREIWKAGEMHQIMWKIQSPLYTKFMDGSKTMLRPMAATRGMPEVAVDTVYPYFTNLSIDLIDSGKTVYHIGNASLYGETSFFWTIPLSIPQSTNYKIRVSMWKNVPRPFDCKITACPMMEQMYPVEWGGFMWDESDFSFVINNSGISPTPAPTPVPDNATLRKIRQQIADTISQLQRTLALIDQILGDTVIPMIR